MILNKHFNSCKEGWAWSSCGSTAWNMGACADAISATNRRRRMCCTISGWPHEYDRLDYKREARCIIRESID
ncbi:MAG: hypothetical protein IJR02_08345 [Bacteroidaceae bacterium]|nr:hypothetical protein [Bacteroidaceae bacterium]